MFHVVFVFYCIIDSYLCVSYSGSVSSIGEERVNLSAIVYLWLCGFCSERFPLPLVALGWTAFFILALP